MFALIWAKLGKYVMGVAAIAALIASIYMSGRRAQKQDRKVNDLNTVINTQNRILDAEINVSASAALERMRRNGQLRD